MMNYKDRVGETRLMHCGQSATITNYNQYNDISIQFEDGTIVERCNYYNFLRGGISNPSLGQGKAQKQDQRVGEKKVMNNHLSAQIINYHNAHNIDVQFEDGTIVYHKSYANFNAGKITLPVNSPLGEKKKMKNGLVAEIIKYENSKNIDVIFEDGEIVTNKGYGEFKNGSIANPSLGKFASVAHKFQSRVGEKSIMGNGMVASIIAYRKYTDIDVLFEDNTQVTTTYAAFKNKRVLNPNFIISGESIFEGVILYYLAPYGFAHFKAKNMKEAGYGYFEIDVFNPDSQIGIEVDGIFHTKDKDYKKNRKFFNAFNKKLIRIRDASLPRLQDGYSADYYIDMNKGAFSDAYEIVLSDIFEVLGLHINPNLTKDREKISRMYYLSHSSKRVNSVNRMNCGMEATVIAYRRSDDIDVMFEDGTIVKNKTYKSFIKGEIANPKKHVGEKKMMNCGMEATIIAYKQATDIDIQFADGTIVERREYGRFLLGEIRNPNLISSKRLGETRIMNCGMEATIIAYRRSDDIDVKFRDGTVINKKTYKAFVQGRIMNPNCSIRYKRIGESMRMNCGMKATIIEYRNAENIDVQFEDGLIVKNKMYGNFKQGAILHPLSSQNTAITNKDRKKRIGEKKMMNCGMAAEIIEYREFKNIDVKFTNGIIVQHRTYDQFKRGTISYLAGQCSNNKR